MSVKGDRLSGRMGSNVFEWELYYKEQSMLVHAREKERVGEQTGVKTMSGQKRERGAGGRPTTKLEKAFKILTEGTHIFCFESEFVSLSLALLSYNYIFSLLLKSRNQQNLY